MPQYMRRHPPLFSMLDMCIDAALVNGIKPLSFVYHGCLSHSRTSLIRIINEVPRDVIFGDLRRIVRRWSRSRWADFLWGFGWRGALGDLRCGGIIRCSIREGEAGARKSVWMKNVEAADQSEEKDEGSKR